MTQIMGMESKLSNPVFKFSFRASVKTLHLMFRFLFLPCSYLAVVAILSNW